MRPRKRSDDYERLVAQEQLILEATEAIVGLLEERGVSRQELAQRLGKSKGFVSQLLSGERNMTLRTLSDLGYALGSSFSIVPRTANASTSTADVLRSLFASLGSGTRLMYGSEVEERMRAIKDRGADLSDSHVYSLAA